MADLNLQLIDTGTNFILLSDDTETEIEYGQLAISLVNTDYDDMYQMLVDFLQSNHALRLAMDLQNSNNKNINTKTAKPEIINIIIQTLYKPMSELLAREYLRKEQAIVITLLLMADIRSRLVGTKIDLGNPEYYMPLIYSDRELHQHIKNILLHKDFAYISPLQDKINQIQLTSSIILTEQGQPYQSYVITDIFDYLILDLQKYLIGKQKVNECECCHKLFLPIYRSTERYCMFNHVDKYRSCREYMKRTSSSDFQKVRDNARGYQSKIHNASIISQYDETFLDQLYKEWSMECTKKYKEYKSKNDLKGFKKWIEETKFTADRLKELYKNHRKTSKNSVPPDNFDF